MASADVSCTALTVTGTTRGAIREEDLNPETICLSNTSTHLSQHGQGWGSGVGGAVVVVAAAVLLVLLRGGGGAAVAAVVVALAHQKREHLESLRTFRSSSTNCTGIERVISSHARMSSSARRRSTGGQSQGLVKRPMSRPRFEETENLLRYWHCRSAMSAHGFEPWL